MKRGQLQVLPLLVLVGFCCTGAAGTDGLLDADRVALLAMIEEDTRAAQSSDWDALTGLYAPDAVRMPPNQPTIAGREAIRSYHAEFPQLDSFDFTLLELDGRGDLAWYRGAYTMTFTVPGTTDAVTDSGKVVAILRKQADGSWLTIADIWNSDLPLVQ